MTKINSVCPVCQTSFVSDNYDKRIYCSLNCFHYANSKRRYRTPEYFWSKVEKTGPNGCWLWKGRLNEDGYGKLKYHGKQILAHRLAYELLIGPIPEGLEVCHNCPGGDNPACVNVIQHIFLGTHLDNMRDMKVKGHSHSFTGENHPLAKLTWKDIEEIRAKYKPYSYSSPRLAKEYGISHIQILNIVKHKSWT